MLGFSFYRNGRMVNELKEIIVYGAKWCPHCVNLTSWLNEKEIPYAYKDIDVQENEKEFRENGGTVIPYTIVRKEEKLTGFNKDYFADNFS